MPRILGVLRGKDLRVLIDSIPPQSTILDGPPVREPAALSLIQRVGVGWIYSELAIDDDLAVPGKYDGAACREGVKVGLISARPEAHRSSHFLCSRIHDRANG